MEKYYINAKVVRHGKLERAEPKTCNVSVLLNHMFVCHARVPIVTKIIRHS